MRAFHIGVAALAAALVAGCGGGSDTRENELTAKVEELEAELEKRATPEQVTEQVTDARNEGREEGRREGAREGNRLAEEAIEDKEEAEDELEEAQQELVEERAQGNLRVRVPKVITALATPPTEFTGSSVTRERGKSQVISFPAIGTYDDSTSLTDFSGWSGSRYARDLSGFNEELYFYTNIGAANTRSFWKLYGLSAARTVFVDDDGNLRSTAVISNSASPRFLDEDGNQVRDTKKPRW